ncbi:MAG: TrkA family potassium uptake protein [Clostridia bacterium]|jgi:trk system potassium uptake protein TrkA|nr:TrkA family potassium uptake protein [Clostridia bacterium]
MKQFVVIGIGRFGSAIAQRLYELGHEVLAIDVDEEEIQKISDKVTHAVTADASDENVLRSLGVRNFDVAVVSIGDDIQSSIIITLMLKELGVKYVVAKAQNDLHAKVLYKIGADRVVFPERDMGERVAHNLIATNILESIELSPDFSIIEFKIPHAWVGKNLRDLNLRVKYGVNVVAIKDAVTDQINATPMADDNLSEESVLVVIGSNEDLKKLEKKVDQQ